MSVHVGAWKRSFRFPLQPLLVFALGWGVRSSCISATFSGVLLFTARCKEIAESHPTEDGFLPLGACCNAGGKAEVGKRCGDLRAFLGMRLSHRVQSGF